MTKKAFLSELSQNLKRLPLSEINKSTDFYSELIDDKIEDGMSETDAVESLGNTADVAKKIIEESQFRNLYASAETGKIFYSSAPPSEVIYTKTTPTWLIVLLSITAIVWVPVAFALVISLWAVIFSLIVAAFALVLSGFVLVVTSPIAFTQLGGTGGLLTISTGLTALGLGILTGIGLMYSIKGFVKLTQRIFRSSKRAFNKGENNK